MTRAGAGVLGIWHDVAPGTEAAVEDWYNRQHHAERLDIPGFLRARRYQALDDGPRIFSRYDVERPEVLQSPAYLAMLNTPTEWTRRMMPHYRGMCRVVFRRLVRLGRGDGGFAVSLRLPEGTPGAEALLARMASDLLPGVLAAPLVLSAETWLADPGATRPPGSEEARLRGGADAILAGAMVVEGTDPDALRSAVAPLRAALTGATEGLHRLVFGLGATAE
jgi:hypothetical protein